jgi:hypothetical protein
MNWSLLIGFAAIGITVVGAAFAVVLRQAVSEVRLSEQIKALEKSSDKAFADMKAEHMRSATEQGTRLGTGEDRLKVLEKFQAKLEGAEERERDLSGVVRR